MASRFHNYDDVFLVPKNFDHNAKFITEIFLKLPIKKSFKQPKPTYLQPVSRRTVKEREKNIADSPLHALVRRKHTSIITNNAAQCCLEETFRFSPQSKTVRSNKKT